MGKKDIVLTYDCHERLYDHHKKLHSLKFSSKQDDLHFQNFKENHNFIKNHNSTTKHHSVGLNKLAHWSHEQYTKWLGCRPKSFPAINKSSKILEYTKTNESIPEQWDWRTFSVVCPIKDQGQCGSCWAFSTVSSVESAIAIDKHELVPLSEQQLVDCSTANNGCEGGLPDLAMTYIKDNGISDEKSYPYTGKQGSCKYKGKASYLISGIRHIESDEVAMAECIYKYGPMSVAINASGKDLMFYSHGIYCNQSLDKNELDHAVTIVGYGTQNGQDYWIVRNSWGPDWGLGGYILMARNMGNVAGIASYCHQPIS